MRSWHPILPKQLDRQALLSEHGEVHIMLGVLAGYIERAWHKHPETLRWTKHRRALIKRHNLLAQELRRRGFHHGTPVHSDYWPPSTYRDAKGPVPLRQDETLASMKAKLRAKIQERARLYRLGLKGISKKAFLAALSADKSKGVFE